jgi:phosphate transport system substrate-binding protein
MERMEARLMKIGRSISLFGALLVFLCVSGFWNQAAARETIRLSCSAQVYEAFRGETLETFTKKTGISVKVEIFSSSEAIARLENGLSDVCTTAEELENRYKLKGYLAFPFCNDALEVIANVSTPVENVTRGQLRGIFSGAIANWKQVDGPDRKIVVIIPSRQTAAFKNFSRMIMKGNEVHFDMMTSRSTAVVEAVRNTPWSISFATQGATLGNLEGNKVIKVNGLWPRDASYPYIQTFSIVTKGKPEGAVKKFVHFVFSNAGAKILIDRGMTPYAK